MKVVSGTPDFYSLWLPAKGIDISLNNELKDDAAPGEYVIYLEAYAPGYKDVSTNTKWRDDDQLPLLERVKVVEFTIEDEGVQGMQVPALEDVDFIETVQTYELETEVITEQELEEEETKENDSLIEANEEPVNKIDEEESVEVNDEEIEAEEPVNEQESEDDEDNENN